MELHLAVEPRRVENSRAFSRITRLILNLSGVPYMSPGPARLGGMVRTPYDHWRAEFDHHPLKYERKEIKLASELIEQLVAKKSASLLGNASWMADMMASLQRAEGRSAKDIVERLLQTTP
ncbi:hypothetical protein ACFT38_42680 [Streptomyces sp. NPDC056975]|uniref:hypothetical protein n=1 Tax=Streptomyces sp. NPDC056975 TaxID=3345985 RepID=UPI00362507C0